MAEPVAPKNESSINDLHFEAQEAQQIEKPRYMCSKRNIIIGLIIALLLIAVAIVVSIALRKKNESKYYYYPETTPYKPPDTKEEYGNGLIYLDQSQLRSLATTTYILFNSAFSEKNKIVVDGSHQNNNITTTSKESASIAFTDYLTSYERMFQNTKGIRVFNLTNFKPDKVKSYDYMFQNSDVRQIIVAPGFKFGKGMFKNCVRLTVENVNLKNFNTSGANFDEVLEDANIKFSDLASKISNSSSSILIPYIANGSDSAKTDKYESYFTILVQQGVYALDEKFDQNEGSRELVERAKAMINTLSEEITIEEFEKGVNSKPPLYGGYIALTFNSTEENETFSFFNDNYQGKKPKFRDQRGRLLKNSIGNNEITKIKVEFLEAIESFEDMFLDTTGFPSVSFDNLKAEKATSFKNMFKGSDAISINLGDIVTSKVVTAEGMFSGCENLEQILLPTSGFNVGKSADNMFYGTKKLKNIEATRLIATGLTSIKGMFKDSGVGKIEFNDTFDVSQVTNAEEAFDGFQGSLNIQELTFNNLESVSALLKGAVLNEFYMGKKTIKESQYEELVNVLVDVVNKNGTTVKVKVPSQIVEQVKEKLKEKGVSSEVSACPDEPDTTERRD